MSTRVTDAQFQAAYATAVEVYSANISAEQGALDLEQVHELNYTSAKDFIYDYRCMRVGQVFHRGMSAAAIEYFLSGIEAEHGKAGLDKAVASVRAHIEYSKAKFNQPMHKLRAVIETFEKRMASTLNLASYTQGFVDSVARASLDSTATRRARLAIARKLPLKVTALTEIFLRNPDVVAETLSRAAGDCEGCHQPAPFIRRKDGTPYLEVHHVVQLAHGGEDTVANAIALCPNCHRYRHFG